ncbi:TrbI/VirB10 family protein [Maritalea sp.]|uniref:TrbI/VirB10 family protein n=1 Tax=Maritalea sp. TaxID=2003361 RepID=UPI003EF27FDA
MAVPIVKRNDGGFSHGPRLNKIPAIIIFVLIMLFIGGLLYGAKHRSQVKEQSNPGKVFDMEIVANDTVDFLADKPNSIAGTFINESDLNETAVEEETQTEKDIAEWLANQQIQQLKRESDMRDRFEQKQIDQYESALASSMEVIGFGGGAQAFGQSPPSSQSFNYDSGAAESIGGNQQRPESDEQREEQERSKTISELIKSDAGMKLLTSLGIDPNSVNTMNTDSSSNTNGVDRSNQFIEEAKRDTEFVLDAKLETPRGPYELKTGDLISGAMISAVNSDLPGDIVAQVTRNVMSSASGKYLLIPQGTKLFGKYDAYTQMGQERLVIVWNRLVFEDGETLNIGGMQGYDARGMSGFKDKVNTHFLRTLANALLISVVNASGEALVDSATDKDSSGVTINLASEFADTTSSAFNEYLTNRLKIKPTIEIRAGYEFNIVVSKDINFPRPYERGFKSYNTSR